MWVPMSVRETKTGSGSGKVESEKVEEMKPGMHCDGLTESPMESPVLKDSGKNWPVLYVFYQECAHPMHQIPEYTHTYVFKCSLRVLSEEGSRRNLFR